MRKQASSLKPRDFYLNKLIAFQDTEQVKVITGIRRCGKSSLLRLMAQHFRDSGIAGEQIIEMNFESMLYRDLDAKTFYQAVVHKCPQDKKAYLFFDEVQRIPNWQDAVNSFRVDFECDIYITGSNAYLLSSEFATYLAGRFVEIKMLPLSFREFIDFHGYTLLERNTPAEESRKLVRDVDGTLYSPDEMLEAYLKFGGMPGIADVGLDQDKALTLLDGIPNLRGVEDK